MVTQTREVAVEMGEKWMDLECISETESAELGGRFNVQCKGAGGCQGQLPGSLT